MTLLKEARCIQCNRKLGEFDGSFSVKCPKCRTVNEVVYDDKQRKELEMYMEAYENLLEAEEGRKALMRQMFYDNKQMQETIKQLKEDSNIIIDT